MFAPEDPPREMELVEASETVAVLLESCRAIVPFVVLRDGDFIVDAVYNCSLLIFLMILLAHLYEFFMHAFSRSDAFLRHFVSEKLSW